MSLGLPVARKSQKPEPDPKKRSESRRHGVLVRLADDVVEDAKLVAALSKTNMAQHLSDTLRPILKKQRAALLKRMNEEEA